VVIADAKGVVLKSCNYDEIRWTDNGIFVCRDGKWSYINTHGEEKTIPQDEESKIEKLVQSMNEDLLPF
jgi:hypothetical protein